MRLIGNNCGSAWSQTFSFDAFGNLASTGSSSFLPTYNLLTNHYATVPAGTPSYDADGNVLADGFNTYTWDSEGRNASANGWYTTYDAASGRH